MIKIKNANKGDVREGGVFIAATGKMLRFFMLSILVLCYANPASAQDSVRLVFKHITGEETLVKDSLYTNYCEERYSISRLQYYITNISFSTKNKKVQESKQVFLVRAFSDATIQLPLNSNNGRYLSFQIGVDSAVHVAGAQSGALDPLNNMYWAWNSGYVHYKMEGYSQSSGADLQRIEYHLGGFEGENKAMQTAYFYVGKKMKRDKNGNYILEINVDINKFWNKKEGFCIKEQSVIIKAGKDAVAASRSLPAMMELNK